MKLIKSKRLQKDRSNAVYTFSTVEGTGRCLVLSHVAITNIISWLTTGMFYTSFLMIYGIDIVNIGIITFIPYIASCFSVFSPSILERFKKRKIFLGITRLLYYVLNILAITIIPELISDPSARIMAFIITIFVSNVVNAITGSGYTLWHIKFVPPAMRADYFGFQSMFAGGIGIGVSLISSIIADSLAASPYETTVIITLRYIAFFLAMLDVIILMLPKEFSYEHSKTPSVKDIFTLPFKAKPFLMTMAVVFLFTFFTAVPSSAITYYLLNNVGVKYTLNAGINMLYPFVQALLLPFAKKYVSKHGWFQTFAVFTFCTFPTMIMYSCVTAANYIWLFTLVRLLQHVFGVYYNLANSNLIYANLPPEDQTNYLSFHTLISNAASFLGMMAGTGFVAWFGSRTIDLFGITFTSPQILEWAEAFGYIVLPLFVFANMKLLTQNNN